MGWVSMKMWLNSRCEPFFSINIFPLFDIIWFWALCERITNEKSLKHAPIGVVYLGAPSISWPKNENDRSICQKLWDEYIATDGLKIRVQTQKLWGMECKMGVNRGPRAVLGIQLPQVCIGHALYDQVHLKMTKCTLGWPSPNCALGCFGSKISLNGLKMA